MGCVGQTNPSHGGPTIQLKGLYDCTTNILVSETTAHSDMTTKLDRWFMNQS